MTFYEQQEKDFVRLVWNNLPATKLESVRVAIPAAVHYTPFSISPINSIPYNPLACKCEAVLNKFCPVDFNTKTYTCVFCGLTSKLPANYANQISPTALPYQLIKQYSTYEFREADKPHTPAYLFVVDLCLSEEELKSVRQELAQVLAKLPDDASVGLITFNKFAHVYQLTATINTVYCISGTKEYNSPQIMQILGLQVKNDPRGLSNEVVRKFIVPLGPNRDKIIRRVMDIKVCPFITVNQRPLRATGAALNVALTIAQCSPVVPRIVTIVGGPCTLGLGKVIEKGFTSTLRTQEDIYKGENIEHYKKAMKYYESLATRLVTKKIILDMFAFTLDQFGLLEMRSMIENSGGFLIMHEEFKQAIFKDSFKKLFIENEEYPFQIADDAYITVFASKDITINGMLGQAHSIRKKAPFVSENEIGKGGTNVWHLGSLDSLKTLTLLYETVAKQKNLSKGYYLQFKTIFRYKNQKITRVTTIFRPFAQDQPSLAAGFDQQAAAVALARYGVYKSLVEEQRNISQWLDKLLFKFTAYFASYTKGDMQSFYLPQQMKSFPQFMYYLRRCQFISTFGTSPDECYYYRHNLNRQTTQNCISMVQPALLKYHLENPAPEPVMLDEESMQPDVILLLDSYFVLALWYGDHVKSWEEAGYQTQQGYEHIAQLLNSPNQDIQYIKNTRFPTPNFYKIHTGHSKERFLKSRVNPKKTGEENENLLTDDANIKTFTEYLIKLVVNQSVS